MRKRIARFVAYLEDGADRVCICDEAPERDDGGGGNGGGRTSGRITIVERFSMYPTPHAT
jgi:hypothetical protein